MAIRIFTISIQDEGSGVEALNGFLASHRVMSIDRRWVEQGTASCWCFCVDYLEASSPVGSPRFGVGKTRIDYQAELQPAEFALYAKLRDARKAIAQAEGVPVYTIFTNEQMAQMVQNKVKVKSDLEKITGVGDGRIEKYGARMLAILAQAGTEKREAGSKPV